MKTKQNRALWLVDATSTKYSMLIGWWRDRKLPICSWKKKVFWQQRELLLALAKRADKRAEKNIIFVAIIFGFRA
jgi:hypothetical protein